MLTISAKGVYGLTAMVELAVNKERGPVQIKDIAGLYSIPQHYLEQILVILKRAGLVKSYRGAQGGYALAVKPEKILISDILSKLEGSLETANQGRNESKLEFFWQDLEASIQAVLNETLHSLVERKMENGDTIMYYI